METLTLALLVLLFLFLSGFFSGSETGILSCSPFKARNLENRDERRPAPLQSLLDKKQQVIIVLLVGTNIANTVYSLAGERFILHMWQSPLCKKFLTEPGFLLTTAILSPLLIIFGEIFPKALFRHYSFSLTRAATPLIAGFYRAFSFFSLPFVIFRDKAFKTGMSNLNYNRTFITLLTESGIETGKLFRNQEKIIRHLLACSHMTVSSFAEPIPEKMVLVSTMNRKQILKAIRSNPQSPYFVAHNGKIAGFLSLNEVWGMPLNSTAINHTTPSAFLSPQCSVVQALKHLLLTRSQFALVGDNTAISGYISTKKLLSQGQ